MKRRVRLNLFALATLLACLLLPTVAFGQTSRGTVSGTVTDPFKLNAFVKSATKALTVDKDFSLADMAVQFRNIRGENLTFLTSPTRGTETIAGQSVVISDREKALALWQAMSADKMSEWMAANQAKPSTSAGG